MIAPQLQWLWWLAWGLVTGVVVSGGYWLATPHRVEPVRIGVVHALTGSMAVSETPLVDAVRLAVEGLNAAGGLLGHPVEMVVADSRSQPEVAAREALRLIERERVSALFACWTSSCRKAVKPVVERLDHLLFYPVQYEGMESSHNIVYTGAAPNQQIVPGARWAMERLGRRVFLVGSDYVFPRIANLILRDLVRANSGEVVAERYLPLNGGEFSGVVAEIGTLRPDVVLSTINGDGNGRFFSAMVGAGLADQPVVSFSVAEGELRSWGGGRLTRHYGVWSYFQSLPEAESRRFVALFQARFGRERVVSDPMVAAYTGVLLWAQTVRNEGSVEPERISDAIVHTSVAGPAGIAAVDSATRHLWKMVRVGRALPDGQYEQVYASNSPLRPAPWPTYRSRLEWQGLVAALVRGEAP